MNTKFNPTKSILFAISFAIVAMFTACEQEEAPSLSVIQTNVSVPAEASMQERISFTANRAWTATVNAEWLTISPASGEGNEALTRLTLSVQTNYALEARTATVNITSGELSRNVTITQAGATPALSLGSTFTQLEKEEYTHIIDVTSTTAWTAEAVWAGESANWISITPTSGVGNGTITVSVNRNVNTSRRLAFVSVTAGTINRQDTIFQMGEIAHDPYAVTINGVTWASRNVNNFGWFAINKEDVGMYYQFNRPTAYRYNFDGTTTPQFPTGIEINENSDWTFLNDPCPTGWRVPNYTEMENLRVSGFRWVAVPFAGAWFGTDAQTASFDSPGNAVFLPAGGSFHDILRNQEEGRYWTGTQMTRGDRPHTEAGTSLRFHTGGANSVSTSSGFGKGAGLLVRCVKK